MAVRIGISPIAWQNDDLPDITASYTMDDALRESAAIGYRGVERGQRMPSDTDGLRAFLDRYGLSLCGGWCSGGLLGRTADEEIEAIRGQVEQFVALGSPCIVYAECSNTIQGDRNVPVNDRPRLDAEAVAAYGAKLTEVAEWCAGQGMPLAYHHHMGSIIESGEDVDRLMEATGPAVGLCYDTGHLRFGGADPLAVLDRWSHRVAHVHYKDVRMPVVERVRSQRLSFLDAVIAGAFTVPGDPEGAVDFAAVTDRLSAMGYEGWIVVEAEQDPAKADPTEYSRMGFEEIRRLCAAAGLVVA
ncbi:myo-inosose-2 dehydratase [Jannaschia sp. W003]|uniref:myo-inosose-2 dehydratase n=1 Tax=Jannaschia sp. W003 TaxID=2867012 RepID=UPI0021A6D736|nr:myo-inosose-2 dehydratase [Jannaschia sp. W003]UWQ21542.1 myo-inosose-2 dehydratase [Jannaschia sp. W003]